MLNLLGILNLGGKNAGRPSEEHGVSGCRSLARAMVNMKPKLSLSAFPFFLRVRVVGTSEKLLQSGPLFPSTTAWWGWLMRATEQKAVKVIGGDAPSGTFVLLQRDVIGRKVTRVNQS
jgi:hypothetical protein